MEKLLISKAEWRAAKARTDEWARALVLPHGWREITVLALPILEAQRAYTHRDGRHVIGSVGQHDGEWWLHLSVSRGKYIPST